MAKQPAFKAATPRVIPPPPELVLSEPVLEAPVEPIDLVDSIVTGEPPAEVIEPTIPSGPRRIRVTPPYGYPIHIAGQGILVRPGTVTEVEEDAWVRAQLRAGIFRET